MKKHKKTVKKKVIGFSAKASRADVYAVLMARMGFSYQLIRERTGLTINQVKHRIVRTGSHVGAYRRGESEISKRVIDATQGQTRDLVKMIKNKMLVLK